jgi:ketosteroid isomerase-like protein
MMIDEVSLMQERNKRIVEIYFEALDQGDLSVLDQLFSGDCLIHRPGRVEPLRGIEGISSVVKGATERYRSLSTKINAILAEGNLVACRLSHRAEFARPWDIRIGTSMFRTVS